MTSSNINWQPGDIIALTEEGVLRAGMTWDRARVVHVCVFGDALHVARRLDKCEGFIPTSWIKGRWVLETSGRRLTEMQRRVLHCLSHGPAADYYIAQSMQSSCASARSRIAELRKLGYRISVEKSTRTYTLEK